MNLIQHFLDWLTESEEARERRVAEAYLAQATDRIDLEYRIRELDARGTMRATTYSH